MQFKTFIISPRKENKWIFRLSANVEKKNAGKSLKRRVFYIAGIEYQLSGKILSQGKFESGKGKLFTVEFW